jgi:hypothetical protein
MRAAVAASMAIAQTYPQSYKLYTGAIISTVADFDSFWDSPIGETPDSMLVLEEEQHRWVEQ